MADQSSPAVKLTDAQKVEAVCAMVVNGQSLNKAVKDIFKDNRKFWEAITKDPKLRAIKDAALDIRIDHLAHEIIEIADTEPDPNKARNMISARTWLASKLKPRSYGDRMELNVSQQINILGVLEEARGRTLSRVMDAEIVPTPELQESNPTPGEALDIFS